MTHYATTFCIYCGLFCPGFGDTHEEATAAADQAFFDHAKIHHQENDKHAVKGVGSS